MCFSTGTLDGGARLASSLFSLVEHFCKTPKNHELVFFWWIVHEWATKLFAICLINVHLYLPSLYNPRAAKKCCFPLWIRPVQIGSGLANWNGCVLRWAIGPLWRFFLMWGFRCKTLRWKVYLSLPHEKSTQEWIMTSIRPPSSLGEVVNNRI